MPTYNAAKWVSATIDNLIAQTYPDIELIVVDDASEDDTVSVVRQKLARDFKSNWKVIELTVNIGPSGARNIGIRAASGAWIQFLDSDDLISATKFERQMEVCAQTEEGVSAVYSPFRRCYVDNGRITWEGPLTVPDMEGRPPIMCLVGGVRPLLSAGLVRRSVLEQIGGFDETLRFWECEELKFRIAKAGRLVPVPSPEPFYLWRMHRGKLYIGADGARYRTTPVAFGWLDQILKATEHLPLSELGLSAADRRMLLDDFTVWARLLYTHDRPAFRRYLARARLLDPDIAPTHPAYAAAASRYVGYEAAEFIAKMGRRPKVVVKRALQKLGLWPEASLFDWN